MNGLNRAKIDRGRNKIEIYESTPFLYIKTSQVLELVNLLCKDDSESVPSIRENFSGVFSPFGKMSGSFHLDPEQT